MSLDPIVTTPADVEQPTGVYGWDWSSTTHDAKGSDATVGNVLFDMIQALGPSYILPGKGKQGWPESVQCFDGEGYTVGRVFFGGDRTDVHVESTSASADAMRGRVVGQYRARTARVDTRVDSLADFDELVGIMWRASESYGSQFSTVEQVRGATPGRTVYLGAPSSAVRVRLYEKWRESPGQYVEGTNRVEVQLRPGSRVKERVSSWSRAETFCASRVTRNLADRLGCHLVPPASLHVNRGTPDLERSLAAMGKQYGPAAERWIEQHPDDYDTIARYLFGLPG